ncbi:MAG TPA: nucleotide exchange factor GrpE [Rhodospirillaceae bacterium]|nr:nucleotide exchange factor GrpE [Rhodospirillaceae bacterium]
MSDQDKNQDAPAKANADEATDNVIPEEAVSENEDAAQATEISSDGVEDMTEEEEIADLKDKLLRTLADMENLRRRSQKDREDALKYSSANFARDMLSVADNLRRAIESIPEEADPDGSALVGFIEGIALTEKELLSTLERHGIEKIDPMGEKFDPQFHEAMFEIPTVDAESGTVLQVVEAGYVIHDRLLRPAKVGIAKAGSAPAESDDQIDTSA